MAKASPAKTSSASSSPEAEEAAAAELSPFVRDAIREKATRELAALDARAKAIESASKARTDIQAIIASIGEATPSLAAGADVTVGMPAKLKRLKKALDEAASSVEQIAEAIGADTAGDVQEKRAEIERALDAAGIDRAELSATPAAAED